MDEYVVEVEHIMRGLVKVQAESPEDAEERLLEKMATGWAPYNAGCRTTVKTVR